MGKLRCEKELSKLYDVNRLFKSKRVERIKEGRKEGKEESRRKEGETGRKVSTELKVLVKYKQKDYYSLDLKSPPRLGHQPVALWRGSRTFRRWSLTKGT